MTSARSSSVRRRLLRHTLAAGLAVAGLVIGLAACGGDTASDSVPTVTDVNATGRELVTRYANYVADEDYVGLAAFLDAGFQIQRADGTGDDRAAYLANPPKLKSFQIGKTFNAVLSGNVLTARYTIVVDETVDGKMLSPGEAPRLTTFVWHDGEWFLASHASFLLPQSGVPTLTDPSATGRELAERFITILRDKDNGALADFLAAGFQIQRADGSGANRAEYLATDIKISSFELGETVTAVQDGATLTVRWSLMLDETINGEVTGKAQAPRLSTFVWENNGWRLLSHANFNPPAK